MKPRRRKKKRSRSRPDERWLYIYAVEPVDGADQGKEVLDRLRSFAREKGRRVVEWMTVKGRIVLTLSRSGSGDGDEQREYRPDGWRGIRIVVVYRKKKKRTKKKKARRKAG